jgi:hypothetical protein
MINAAVVNEFYEYGWCECGQCHYCECLIQLVVSVNQREDGYACHVLVEVNYI